MSTRPDGSLYKTCNHCGKEMDWDLYCPHMSIKWGKKSAKMKKTKPVVEDVAESDEMEFDWEM